MIEYKLLTQPYTDNKAKWDSDEELYVLDADYFTKRTGIDLNELLGSEVQTNAFLLSSSHRLYNLIDDFANAENRSHNIEVKRYIMARNHSKRKGIIDALVSFVRAAIDTDIDRVGDEWELRGQLLNKTKNIDLPNDTERILRANGLTFSGRYGFEVVK